MRVDCTSEPFARGKTVCAHAPLLHAPMAQPYPSPLGVVQSAERLARSTARLGLKPIVDECAAQLPHVISVIRGHAPIDTEHLTTMLEYLETDKGTFTDDQRKSIGAAAHTRYSSGVGQESVSPSKRATSRITCTCWITTQIACGRSC